MPLSEEPDMKSWNPKKVYYVISDLCRVMEHGIMNFADMRSARKKNLILMKQIIIKI